MTRVLGAALAALVGLAVSGCATEQRQGHAGIVARYDGFQTLRARLPDHVTAPAALAAARAVLERRGYAIERNAATQGGGEVCGVAFAEGAVEKFFARKIIVSADEARPGARVAIRTEPGGRESEARSVLDEILSLLRL